MKKSSLGRSPLRENVVCLAREHEEWVDSTIRVRKNFVCVKKGISNKKGGGNYDTENKRD